MWARNFSNAATVVKGYASDPEIFGATNDRSQVYSKTGVFFHNEACCLGFWLDGFEPKTMQLAAMFLTTDSNFIQRHILSTLVNIVKLIIP